MTNDDLPFDLEAVKTAFKNVKHWSDLSKEGGPLQVMFKTTLETMRRASLKTTSDIHQAMSAPRRLPIVATEAPKKPSSPTKVKSPSKFLEIETRLSLRRSFRSMRLDLGSLKNKSSPSTPRDFQPGTSVSISRACTWAWRSHQHSSPT